MNGRRRKCVFYVIVHVGLYLRSYAYVGVCRLCDCCFRVVAYDLVWH